MPAKINNNNIIIITTIIILIKEGNFSFNLRIPPLYQLYLKHLMIK